MDQMSLPVTTCSSHDLPPHGQYVTYHLHSVNPPTAGIQSDSHKIIEAKVSQLSISKYIPTALFR